MYLQDYQIMLHWLPESKKKLNLNFILVLYNIYGEENPKHIKYNVIIITPNNYKIKTKCDSV